MSERRPSAGESEHRRDMNRAMGCAVALAIIAVVVLIAYLWTV
jgi:hypothetical protein